MQCNTRNAQAAASAEALTVAERDLQRIKQQGCGTTKQDRAIMQLPNLKAFTYPLPTNVPVEVTADSNNKYLGRSSVNAEGFVPPFNNAALEQGVEPTEAANYLQSINLASAGAHGTPGLDFAGSGEISQLDEVMFGSPPVLYKQMAASIRGETLPPEQAKRPTILQEPATSLGRAGLISADEVQNARALERKLYGSGSGKPSSLCVAEFASRCVASVKAALYDWLHYEAAQKHYEQTYGGGRPPSSFWELGCRDGRGPYLVFVAVLCLVIAAVFVWIAKILLFTGRQPAPSFSSLYPDQRTVSYLPVFAPHMQPGATAGWPSAG